VQGPKVKPPFPKLVDDWRNWWRFHSVRAAAALAALSMVQANVLPQIEPIVSPKYWPWVTAAFAIAIVVLRLLAQPDTDAKEPSQ